jgi:large subunit ribosomal protein L40e
MPKPSKFEKSSHQRDKVYAESAEEISVLDMMQTDEKKTAIARSKRNKRVAGYCDEQYGNHEKHDRRERDSLVSAEAENAYLEMQILRSQENLRLAREERRARDEALKEAALISSTISVVVKIFASPGSSPVDISLEMDRSDSVEKICQKIQEGDLSVPDSTRWFFGGKQLEDGKTLQEYNIQKDSQLHGLPLLTSRGNYNIY